MGVTSSNPSESSPKGRNQCISASAPAAEKVYATGKAEGQYYWIEAPFSKANAGAIFDAIYNFKPAPVEQPKGEEKKETKEEGKKEDGKKEENKPKAEAKAEAKKEAPKAIPADAVVTLAQAKTAQKDLLKLFKDNESDEVKRIAKFETIFAGNTTGLNRDAFTFNYARVYGTDGTKEEAEFKAKKEEEEKKKAAAKPKVEAPKGEAPKTEAPKGEAPKGEAEKPKA
jgi:hypothetical protein